MQEYRRSLSVGYLTVVLIIALLLQGVYRDYLESILKLMFTEDYSYLLVSLVTVMLALYLSLRYMGFTYELQLSRLIASLLLVVISMILYHASVLTPENQLQLQGLSFSIAMIAILLMVFKPVSKSDVIPVLTPILMVPVPVSIVEATTIGLSRVIGRLVAVLTNTKYIDMGAFTAIEVETKQGVYTFSVEAACSGILVLSTVIAVFPVLAYYASVGQEKTTRKLWISQLALLTSLAVGFTGNLLRVLAIIIVAKHYSPELAMNVFHYSPSVVYASISVVLAFLLINKYTHVKFVVPRPLATRFGIPSLRWEQVGGILASTVLIALLLQSSIVSSIGANNGEPAGVRVVAYSLDEIVKNPHKYLFTDRVTVTALLYDAFLTRVIGSLSTYRVSLVVNGVRYTGFLEVVDIPARLHTLQLCVSLQGYRVLSSWSEPSIPAQISYILMEKNNKEYILAYVLVPVVVETPTGEYTIYSRVSLFKQYKDTSDLESTREALLVALNLNAVNTTGHEKSVVYVLNIVGLALFTILVVYILVLSAYRLIRILRSRGIGGLDRVR
ncbi:MAG: archaeosortase/exosortase family protein [Desulfurococcaceae archaeon]